MRKGNFSLMKNVWQDLADFCGVKYDRNKTDIHSKSVGKFRKKDMELAFEIADNLTLGKEFAEITGRFNYR